jgi:muramoyltetrapeptide carboxypeptidase
VTCLHLEALRAGVASLHAPNLAGLGRADEATRERWVDAIERPLARRVFSGLEALAPGRASGTLVGGNLTLLFTAAASGRFQLPERSILFFEEVNEAPYRIDRMLTALLQSGQLASVSGVCIGDLTDNAQPGPRRAATSAALGCLGVLGVPVLAGLPVGHGLVNEPLPLGVPACLDGARGELVVNPGQLDLT